LVRHWLQDARVPVDRLPTRVALEYDIGKELTLIKHIDTMKQKYPSKLREKLAGKDAEGNPVSS
jgi:hypothetical protein